MATKNNTNGFDGTVPFPITKDGTDCEIVIKDIDTFYLQDLKCEICNKLLRFLVYDRFSNRKGNHFLVARMFCEEHKNIWVAPYPTERIYLDGPDETNIRQLEIVHLSLANIASDMQGKDIPEYWDLSKEFWGFREDFSDGIKAKLQILRDYWESHKNSVNYRRAMQ